MSRLKVGIPMGSKSDSSTMRHVGRALEKFGFEREVDFEYRVKSVHRTTEKAIEYARTAEERGLKVLVPGAGGSSHLQGIIASETLLPVLGVAITKNPDAMNRSLGSCIGMPEGKPLATFQAEAGAFNAGLMAVRILALNDPELREAYRAYDEAMKTSVIADDELMQQLGPDGIIEMEAAQARQQSGTGQA